MLPSPFGRAEWPPQTWPAWQPQVWPGWAPPFLRHFAGGLGWLRSLGWLEDGREKLEV